MTVTSVDVLMSDFLRTPERRACERCGRVERYNGDTGVWRANRPGEVNCIHEWDIDGTFVPVQLEATPAPEEC